jgi:hypothetical protein
MNTVLITEIKCVMLFVSFPISVMYTLERFLTRPRGLMKLYAEDNTVYMIESRTNARP